MNNPLVSVLMPAYNAEKYIAEAIESVLDQSYKDFELIIADDTSTDSTWEIISLYKKKDVRIVAVRNENNLYIAGNRNKLLSMSKGKYIAWQDSDDISYGRRLERQVKFMEKNKEVGICGGYLDFYFNGKVIERRRYSKLDSRLRRRIFRQSPVAQPASMIRKECFDKVGLFNLDYPPAEDIDMSFRIGSFYKFANISFPLIKYRLHYKSATSKKLKVIMLTTLKIRFKNLKNKAYKFSLVDVLYQIATVCALLLPPLFVYYTFRKHRRII